MSETLAGQGIRPTQEVGHVRVTALLDGLEDIDPITQAFPDAPADQLLAYKERYPGVYGDGGAWRLRVRAWLIRAAGSLILVDTGIGVAGAPGPEWFGSEGALMSELTAEGIRPEDISTVVITHTHDDHVGGNVAAGAPAFPAARYVIQSAELAWKRDDADDEESRTIWSVLLQPLVDAGAIQEVDGTAELAPGVQVQLLPGHTPGHQIVRIASEGRRLVVTGDAIMIPAQLAHPDWSYEGDSLPGVAAESRRRLLAEAGSHPGMVLAPTHFAEPFGKIVTGPDRLAAWQAV